MSWTTCALGHAHWGRRGAAGLLLADRGTVLLQHRASWAHKGGTWSIPGGAKERGESAVQAALREAQEEMAIRGRDVEVRAAYVATCGGWEYETVLAVPVRELRMAHGAESDGHLWAEAGEVSPMKLHPGFRAAWEAADAELRTFVADSRAG